MRPFLAAPSQVRREAAAVVNKALAPMSLNALCVHVATLLRCSKDLVRSVLNHWRLRRLLFEVDTAATHTRLGQGIVITDEMRDKFKAEHVERRQRGQRSTRSHVIAFMERLYSLTVSASELTLAALALALFTMASITSTRTSLLVGLLLLRYALFQVARLGVRPSALDVRGPA